MPRVFGFGLRSCQHRLKYAKNPSAVVMIAIRGVAAKVGRRYYGSRETAEGDETKSVGELKMSLVANCINMICCALVFARKVDFFNAVHFS